MDIELRQQLSFLNENQHAQIALLQEIRDAVLASLWACRCGHVNGANLATCGQCGRQ